jgi:hypothetical protein
MLAAPTWVGNIRLEEHPAGCGTFKKGERDESEVFGPGFDAFPAPYPVMGPEYRGHNAGFRQQHSIVWHRG